MVQLIGESYTDDITLDNIHSVVTGDEPLAIENIQQTIIDDDAPGISFESLVFEIFVLKIFSFFFF